MSKKIKVFVDAEVLVNSHFSGIGHYTLELLRALDRRLDTDNSIEIYLGVFYKRINHLKSFGFNNVRFKRTLLPLRITNGLKKRNSQPYYDLFFGKKIYIFPNYTSWPLLYSKSISIVYDLSFEYFPQYVEPKNQKFLSEQVKKSVERSDKLITISTNSQHEITDFFKVNKKDVPIIYPGIDQSEFFKWPDDEVAKVKARYGINGKYILFVGNIEPRKNLKNLLLAYEKLSKKIRKEYSLLLVGARGWLDNEIFDIIERLRIDGNIIQQPIGYVEDEDRAAIFSGASLFVYPSHYEGFGIPPLEAMACGVPTITSNNSSLPEAVGDGAIKVSSESVDNLAKQMESLLSDSKKAESMIKKGYLQVDKYSWDKEASKLIDVIKEVAR